MLRTPLASVTGLLGRIEDESLNAESWIMEERKAVESDLLALLEKDPVLLERRHESLAAAGLETMVAMIALHGVTGVASGFSGKFLYDKWRGCTTRRQLNNLADEIPAASNLTKKVNDDVIRRDVVEVLMLEGLDSTQAEYLTDRMMARVKSRSAKGKSSTGEP
jgi:hypothetical protein